MTAAWAVRIPTWASEAEESKTALARRPNAVPLAAGHSGRKFRELATNTLRHRIFFLKAQINKEVSANGQGEHQ